MKKIKCWFHPFNLKEQKIYHINHDAHLPVNFWSCNDCGYGYFEEIKKSNWKLKEVIIIGPWGKSTIYKKLDQPEYRNPKIFEHEQLRQSIGEEGK